MKISVIIPTFNQKTEYLDCAIMSVLNQIYPPHEVIIVNDGGKPVDMNITGPNIHYIGKSENGGTASALNAGIALSTGDYLSWLSSDDFFYPEFLATHVSVLEHEMCSAKVSYCGFTSITVNDKDEISRVDQYKPPIENNIRVPFILSDKEFNSILVRNLHAQSCQFNGCAFVIDKSVLSDVGKFEENYKFIQDFDMWFKISKKYDLAVIPNILMGRREHSGRTQFLYKNEEFVAQRNWEMSDMKNKYLYKAGA